MPTNSITQRRKPCRILEDCGIPSVVWFEDALKAYGVPTVLFELYVLVPSIEAAAHALEQNGWKPIPQQLGRIGNALLDLTLHPQLCLSPPSETCTGPDSAIDHEPPAIVLLPATEWNYNFGKGARSASFLPSLEDLLDGLLDSLLDCSDSRLWSHLNVQVAYLYGHVPNLREKAFAQGLLYEHRQYHLDIMAGMNYGTVPFIEHQRKVRNELRERSRELQECSADRQNEDLFNRAVQARLLAAMPDPFAEESDSAEN